MGRPDLTETRTAEILDAFERCVGRFGLEGSSLQRIAEEAGMKRSILRHYVGNRDDLVVALTDRVVTKYRKQLDDFTNSISPEARIDQLIQFMLPPQTQATTDSIMVIESLIAASETDEAIRAAISSYVDDVVESVACQLKLQFTERTQKQCWDVAYGVVCIWFNHESLGPLSLPPKHVKAARSCMRVLIDSLS